MNGDQSAIKLPVALAAYEAAVTSLLSSFTVSQFNPETTHSAFEALLEADKALNEALDEADLHTAQHNRILGLQHQSRSLSTQISSALRTLSTARQTLQHLPTSLAPISTPSTSTTTNTKVDAQTLLSYAAKIAPFTGAPSAALPWPDETKLRVGVLGMGPEAGSLARQRAIEEFQERERRKVEEASQPPAEVKEVVNDVHMEDQHHHEHGEEEEGEDLGLDLFDPDAE
ncbi:hypothetical protein SAICODRAFT_66644 [Saitoella complicata NRRL Y-17804]|uniref:Mediator of RNA polymerase II transcription subunit 4 n=1 Tax=Saitoella complicata (strain BCRC 22490 / CBS 7301 / JCM 7358 / NBRC 10748 / NRRL Y-17804) TaxID=698492 RepID=A0A0E9NFH2_SAICN|nr:uncharacterized protein SAICODRAFT_66644 [Saitoella complicata NRRL Y-17804]ODQ51998.1 hypothetical protein SAICODRAFT_66644 [Saitoella complicata NRRL Y-17804]GAO48612.1 hypothetical protein G7K_2783-t1 [Saitoella complicata NRRL Y-17804]